MRKLAIKISMALSALMPATALAQTKGEIPDSPLSSPITSPEGVVTTLDTISQWLFTIFFALAVVFLVYAAFLYLTAGGNETRVGSAKGVLIYAIVAIVVALIAGGIPLFVSGILGA